MAHSQIQQQALENATRGQSTANYSAIMQGFAEKGIPVDQIEPRVNVFTFHAWKALGRQVRKGEHGVKVCTYVSMSKTDPETGESKDIGRKPRMTTVFHISQTDEIAAPVAKNPDATGRDVMRQLMEARQPAITPVSKSPDGYGKQGRSDYYSTEFTPV